MSNAQPLTSGWPADPQKLAAFIEVHRPRLLAFIEGLLGSQLRGQVEPADILQETYLAASQSPPPGDPADADPYGWLCRLARQRIVDRHRFFTADRRDVGRVAPAASPEASRELVDLLAASITSPSQAAVRGEQLDALQLAVAALPEEHQEILRLRFVEGLPTKLIAEKVGKTDTAIRVLLGRLMHRLQKLMGEEG